MEVIYEQIAISQSWSVSKNKGKEWEFEGIYTKYGQQAMAIDHLLKQIALQTKSQ